MSDVPDFILEFMRAVYPHGAELAIASFDERKALEDATAMIRSLRKRLLQAHIAFLNAWMDDLADGDMYLSDFDPDLIDRLRRVLR